MKLSTVILTILSIGATSVASQETAAPTPAMSTMNPGCLEVSVEGDATFCVQGPICSGSGAESAGTNCPKVGDVATAGCWDYVPSYADAKGCVAPVNAECKMMETGVWGCVWNTGSGSGSGMDGEAGSSSASGSGSGSATITIPVNATSTEENPEDIQFPKNLKATTLSADGSSSANAASTGPIVGIVAAVAGIVCAAAVAAFYRHKLKRREEVAEFAEAIQTPPNDRNLTGVAGRTPLTPPFRDPRAFFSKVDM